ncbi:radical SAM protein [Pelagibacterales bacterium SAG-MED03]|nr:radical SAM protein [Pelagibacterales bacterium SAG-MED03]
MKKNAPIFEDFQNPYKVFYHQEKIKELKNTGDTTPIHITIGLTNFCNHKCPWCYINWNQSGQQSKRSGTNKPPPKPIQADLKIVEALREAKEMGLKAVTIVGDGEPTLHKNFNYIIDEIKKLKIDIGIFSNMSFKKKEIFDSFLKNFFFVRCSIDAANKAGHQRGHMSNDFDLVVDNIKKLVRLRGKNKYPIIGAQYVCNHWNYKEVPEAARFFKSLEIDYVTFKPMYKNELNPNHENNTLQNEKVIPYLLEAKKIENEKFRVYMKTSQFQEVLGKQYNNQVYYKKCNATPLAPYLDEDGSVELCGNLKGKGFKLGNIYEKSFKEIWFSEERKKIIQKINLNNCPAGCKLDPLNKVLWDNFNLENNYSSNYSNQNKSTVETLNENEIKRIHPNFIG